MKLLLKVLALPVILILKIFAVVVNVLIKLSTYVLGPLMLFITICAVYSLVKANWMNVAILAVMDAVIFAACFAAGWITCLAEDACDGLLAFLHS